MSSAGVAVSFVPQDSIWSPEFGRLHLSPPPDESILIYVALPGSMIPLRVLESDSIEAVKLRIQTCKGFFVKSQKLVCGGRELSRNNSLVRDYDVSDGDVLHLVLRLSDLQVIQVRTSCGKEFTFHVERSRDVGYVKHQVARKARGLVDPDEQEVVCNGERLEDQRLIDDISKQNGAVIHLLVRKSAKVRARPVEKNYELSIVASESNGRRSNDVNKETGQRKYDSGEETRNTGDEVDGETFHRAPLARDFWLDPIVVNPKVELSSVVWDMIDLIHEGFDAGRGPMRSMEGTGGAYFMQDSHGRYVSVFKPLDEEPMAVNNPQGLPLSVDGEGLKKGTRVGEGAFREVAAYLLDHPKKGHRYLFGDGEGFAGVPPTVMIKCLHPGFNHPGEVNVKIGSLQMFTENQGSCEDIGPGSFPVDEVHKISVLDIRLANADRHAGNILLGEGRVLIPIDHGYCLPESFEDCTFDWLYWPQARQPYSRETIEYIKALDAEEDIALLKFHGWDLPIKCARTLHISTMLLKKGVERGLTPFAIGNIMCRETLTKNSVIEEIVEEAEGSLLPGSSEAAFFEAVSQIMDCRLNEIAAKVH
ncbi:phosphatidylinositol 4-kinase gamma 4-like [Punica granatum]|uniref:1-phosphatidylinositol 4-kinase n=1 Tax=Punica granatum TaxID=22663 RepID=A0A218W845_PUNGR|nr:phosphatidylinositol 4-kinase gamma 4-like [Punica granatum]OWM68648.1 hypothetical protein CDL15_Pgr023613 [Punica granatum]